MFSTWATRKGSLISSTNMQFKDYNGSMGSFQAVVNMGPVQPPHHKGRVSQYSCNKLVELQQKFNDLERLQVFKWPKDVGICVEYLNPAFLIRRLQTSHYLW